jgi:hypothetical protein
VTELVSRVEELKLYRATGKMHGQVVLRFQVVAPSMHQVIPFAEAWKNSRDAYRHWNVSWSVKQAYSYDPRGMLLGAYPVFAVPELPELMSDDELMRRMVAAFPLAELGQDNEGQIIIHTNLHWDTEGKIVPMDG